MEQYRSETGMTIKQMALNVIRKGFVGDGTLWAILFLLIACSLLAIYSSSLSLSYAKYGGNFNYFLFDKMFMVVIGFFIVFVLRFIPISFYQKHAKLLFILAVGLMIYTYLFGKEINGARRWVSILGLATIQSSDFLKIGLFIYISKVMWKRRANIQDIVFVPLKELLNFKKEGNWEIAKGILLKDSLPLIFPVLISVLLIMPENMSTCMIVAVLSLLLYVLGGVSWREIKKMMIIAMMILPVAIAAFAISGSGRFNTWKSRVTQFATGVDNVFDEQGRMISVDQLSNDEAQRLQSDIAIANGWLFGRGFGNSIQRSNLPNSNSDFVFSFIIEEWGVLGGAFVTLLYIWSFIAAIRVARKCSDSFMAILCMSMGLLFSCSGLFHIAVCVGFAPVTGLTLPLISDGGSSILYTFTIFGILFRISYEQKLSEVVVLEQPIEETEAIEK